jgi:hypothetical protein
VFLSAIALPVKTLWDRDFDKKNQVNIGPLQLYA